MRTSKSPLIKFGMLILLLLTFFGQVIAQNVPPPRPLPIPDARINGPGDIAEGDLWASWSEDHQLGYVQGLLEGSYWGYFHACTEAQTAAKSDPNLNEKCMKHIPVSHISPQRYVAMVTKFYVKYPQDRALPIRRLLMKFLEPGMNVDGVHRWLDELIESVKRSDAK